MKLQNGDVLVDGSTIVNSMNALCFGWCDLKGVDFVRFNSLAQLVHSIVLHERLVTVTAAPREFQLSIESWVAKYNTEYGNSSISAWRELILKHLVGYQLSPDETLEISRSAFRAMTSRDMAPEEEGQGIFGPRCGSTASTPSSWFKLSQYFAADDTYRREIVDRVGSDYGFGGSFLYNTLCYRVAALALGLPYVPNCLRSTIVAEADAQDQRFSGAFAERATQYLEGPRAQLASAANEFTGCTIFDVSLPFVFLYSLQCCDDIASLPATVAQLRESAEARAFRKWASALDAKVADGDLRSVFLAIKDVEDLCTTWLKTMGAATDTFSLTLPVASIDLRIPRLLQRPLYLPRKRHLSFLSNLLLVSERHDSFTSLMRRRFRRERTTPVPDTPE